MCIGRATLATWGGKLYRIALDRKDAALELRAVDLAHKVVQVFRVLKLDLACAELSVQNLRLFWNWVSFTLDPREGGGSLRT